nr:hypothetical protein [uncultured Eubacterium sp.]
MDKQKKREAFMDNAEKAMYREKQHYVERILAPAVGAVGAGVTYLSYGMEGSTEIVTVNYYGGRTDRINVTGNSLLAILHEVVQEIEGHNAHGHISERGESHDRRAED